MSHIRSMEVGRRRRNKKEEEKEDGGVNDEVIVWVWGGDVGGVGAVV